MRTLALILSMALAALVLSCGFFDGGQKAAESHDESPSVVSVVPPPGTNSASQSEAPSIAPGAPSPGVAPISYLGPSSLEERIFASPVIARVRFDSATSTVESAVIYDGSTKYIALLEFRFNVLEYLKGSGATDIVAVWDVAPEFDTRQETEAALPAISGARETRWDGYEAIVFLQHSQAYLPSTQQANRYYLSGESSYGPSDDGCSIASRYSKLWLPSEAAAATSPQPSGDQQRFLMDVPLGMKTDGRILGTLPDGTFVLAGPPATGTAPTITLGEIKTRIAAVAAKLDAGDGSEEYTECVRESYQLERWDRYHRETRPDRVNTGSNISPPHVHQLDSGLAGGTAVYEISEGADITPGVPFEVWLDGENANLFSAASPTQDYRVTTTRPLPAGTYEFHFNHRGPYYSLCDGWAIRYEWTVTVTAPEGTLHEAFFDPVTDSNAVAADSANGVLKPASFTDTNSATSTIQRIAWEPGSGATGTVKMTLSPHDGIANHTVDFIALDGTVSLSLNVADATVDAAANTLTWPAPSQPWHTGDKLMLRIREPR